MEKVRNQILNVGSNSGNYTINDLVDLTVEVFPESKIRRNNDLVDNRNYRVDFSKIEKCLDYKACITVQEGLNELKDLFGNNLIADPDDKRHSNITAIKEYYNDK